MKHLLEYFRRLTLGGNKESSKRFLAVYIGFPLATYVVVRFTTVENMEMVLAQLLTFVISLLGIASYENHKSINKGLEETKPKDDESTES